MCRMSRPLNDVADAEPTRLALLQLASARTPALSACGPVDAELLLAHILMLSRTDLRLDPHRPVPARERDEFLRLLDRRLAGEPLAYITGQREFWSLMLEVTPAVLVPRPETELLVERALELCQLAGAHMADLGTGSGAIALAVASERPTWNVVGVDCSAAALRVARRNAANLHLTEIDWRLGDWFEPLVGQRFDLILSNPPYVCDDDAALSSDGVCCEPRLALVAGRDGFDALRVICAQAPQYLRPKGALALEHGSAQGDELRKLLVAHGFVHVRSHPDLAGLERVTEAIWPG